MHTKKTAVSTLLLLLLSLFSFESEASQSEPELTLGGAVRLNYSYKDYGNDDNGSFEFELFRLDAKATQGKWFLDAQYRWYQDFDAIHHAEIGYVIDQNNTVVAGVTQVPFGIAPYASHSFWFGGTYYLGLEDDYDTGIKWQHKNGNWLVDSAWFFNSEYSNGAKYDRYSFDVASSENSTNQEDGQLNSRVQYKLGKHTLGTSVQWGRFLNTNSQQSGKHWAVALHADTHFNDWNIQAQWLAYHYDAKPQLGTQNHRVALSAFQYPFEIASKAQVLSLNVARKFTINNDFVDTLTCYNDHSYIRAAKRQGLGDSIQNVTGCMLAKGGIYTYIDWIAGKNMWFAGGSGVGIKNGESRWHSRLNINIGYYF